MSEGLLGAAILSAAELEAGLLAWREAVLGDPQARWDSRRDLAYWQHAAEHFEEYRQPIPHTIAAVQAQLRPAWSLLDVGAGTGRFTRPLAPFVRQITALDYSADMLAVLVAAGLPAHVRVWQRDFHAPDIPPHDAVLAAWALYRSPDLRADVERLWGLARHLLLVLEDNGLPSPHVAWKRRANPAPRLPYPRTALIAGILHERAQVSVLEIREQRVEEYPSLEALLARHKVDASQSGGFLAHLSPYLAQSGAGVRYTFEAVNTLVVAQR